MAAIVTSEPISTEFPPDSEHDVGAELIFHGRVRGCEEGKPIKGIFYEHYEGMATKELEKLNQATKEKFPVEAIHCIHRVGFVPNGEVSLRLIIWSRHRKEGLDAMAWYISTMKKEIPIWKNVRYV
jgi:molybdopterin synthase catalytic subunit